MIPKTIRHCDIIAALKKIDEDGVPSSRLPKHYYVKYNDKLYPPKYLVSLASQIANGNELYPFEFGGGKETNYFLQRLGFEIIPADRLKGTSANDTPTSIVTVTIKSNTAHAYSNTSRNRLLEQVIDVYSSTSIILLPAGFFELSKPKDKKIIEIAESVAAHLRENNLPNVVAFGIDCDDGADQLAVAVNADGILAIGRKFHPTAYEQGIIRSAESFSELEMGYSRCFDVNGKRFYLAVCYDGFGVRQCNLANPGVDAILILVHQFRSKGEGPSGDVDFARKGFAGASLQWKCPAFGTAVFFDREIPANWPTGVIYKDAEKGVRHFRYQDNELHWEQQRTIRVDNELALCYLFFMN
jgi:hypothetical protein